MKRLILATILPTLTFIAQSEASEKREEPQPHLVFDLEYSSQDEGSQDETQRTQHVTIQTNSTLSPRLAAVRIARLTHENEEFAKHVDALSEASKTEKINSAICNEQWSKACLLNCALEDELTAAQKEIKRLRRQLALANKAAEGKVAPKSVQAPQRPRAVSQRNKENAVLEGSSDAIAEAPKKNAPQKEVAPHTDWEDIYRALAGKSPDKKDLA